MEKSNQTIQSMSHTTNRSYEDEKDFQILIDLLTKLRPPAHLDDYPVKVDIEEDLASASVRVNTRLWFDDGEPIGWAYVDDFRNLWWELDPHYEELLGPQIVAWGESCIQKTLAKGASSTLDTSCREDYTKRISFLKHHGFHQTEETTIAMVRLLSEPIPQPKPPQGFVIRPIAGIEEAEAVATTHRTAFGTEYMTTEIRLAMMNTCEYDPSLDLVVVAPDGAIAAYCTCSVNQQVMTGSTDPVATHPRYQRMGLARALLLRGMQLLRERGVLSAHLGTGGDNIAMQKTARSVGFTVGYTTIWFSRGVV